MGYQLWTSPITGYRRHGTRLTDFSAALGGKITVGAIFEPLRSCPSEAAAYEMHHELTRLDFDVAGVRDSIDEPVIGFVRREQLKSGRVRDHMEQIPEDAVVHDSTGIDHLMIRLRTSSFLFISTGCGPQGILTLADLNKPIVRVYFFGLLSLLEIHMSFWISQHYQGDSWKSILKPARIEYAEAVQSERKRRGQNLDLVDCLQFSDKRELVIVQNHLRDTLRLGSKNGARRWFSDAENLRNALAHSLYDLTQGTTWSNLIDLVHWVTEVIRQSDASVDRTAALTAQGYIGALW